jgi:hypothetical protein
MDISAIVSNRSIRVLVVVLAMLMYAGSAAAHVPAAEPEHSSVDLAAVVLTPDDLAQAGLPGLGFESGQYVTAQDMAAIAIWPTGAGPELDALTAQVEEAGFQQAYNARATTNRESGDLSAIVDVEWGVTRYATPEGAAMGFTLLPDALVTGTQSTEQGTETIGDDSRITRIDAHDPGAGSPSAELVLGFRTGAITAHVLLRRPVDSPPNVDQIEQLARMLAHKIEHASAEAPGLSECALYAEPRDDMTYRTAAYLRLNEADVPLAFESADDTARRVDGYGRATDVFQYQTEIRASDSDYALIYATTLYRFADAARASAWLREQPDRLRASAGRSDLIVGTGIDAGDESINATLTTTPGADPIHWEIVYVRTGAIVAEISLSRVYQAPASATTRELATMQASCLLHQGGLRFCDICCCGVMRYGRRDA